MSVFIYFHITYCIILPINRPYKAPERPATGKNIVWVRFGTEQFNLMVGLNIYTHTYTYTYTYIYMYTYTRIHIQMHIYRHIHMYTCINVYIRIYICRPRARGGLVWFARGRAGGRANIQLIKQSVDFINLMWGLPRVNIDKKPITNLRRRLRMDIDIIMDTFMDIHAYPWIYTQPRERDAVRDIMSSIWCALQRFCVYFVVRCAVSLN